MAAPSAVIDAGHLDVTQRPLQPDLVITTRVEVSLLGGFEVRVNGAPVASTHWSRRDTAALVKLLALSARRSLHREQVLDALWPDVAVDVAAPRLHKAAHYARKALGQQDAVVLSADTVSLCPDDDLWVDVVRFRSLTADALSDGGIASAEAALALYAGDVLPGDPYESWSEPHRRDLHRLYVEMLHQAEDWHRALAADPANETAHLALAERHSQRGDRVAALRQLDQLERAIREDLGLDPSERALELRRRIVQAVPNGSRVDATTGVDDPPPPCPAAVSGDQCCA